MYKKLLIFLVAFWVFGNALHAQEQSDHKGAVLNGGAVFKDTDKNLQMQFQIGGSFLYDLNSNQHFKVDFPFGVNYVPNTFSENTFEVSKGYYEDNIRISWSVGANEENIQKFQIFRRRLGGQDSFQLIATLGTTVFEYLDTQVEGGVLYEYKVSALGISNIEQKFVTFIEGIGYRSPTAFVSGSITFEGGSPVKDVTVFAEPIGAEATSVGTSIQFTDFTEHIRLNNRFTNVSAQKLSVQGWFAPSINQENQKLFYFTDSNGIVYTLYFYYAPDGAGKKIMARFTEGSAVVHSFELRNSYPTGKINARGDDVFANIADITDTTFLHVSLVLENNSIPRVYINGRAINQTYVNGVKTINEGVSLPVLENVVSNNYANTLNLNFVGLGAEFVGYVDEFRLWRRALNNAEIRRDYKRYLDGSESGLAMYNRMDEGYGNFAYDLSKTGFNFHKRDLVKSIFDSENTKFSDVVPTKDQLGIFGITDEDGSYAISAIPYAGSGEQFKITPSFGVHKFKPASQTLFLGKEESVVNQVNFEDISSFKFNGKIVYDTRGVFNDLEITDPNLQNITEIRETGYNKYLVNGTTTIDKGQYYYDGGSVDTNTGNLTGGTLKRYPVLGVADANIYIDGNLVLDEDNQPVLTDAEGKFSINVPIGRHKIEVEKQGHVFSLNGRFPQKTNNAATNLFDFYEDQIQERWFIDETRVTVVGRVVGGRIESEKEIGFGFDGIKKHTNEVAEGEPENIETYSSVNNIGKATITLKGDKDSNDLDYVFETNAETGEYKIKLVPYIYNIVSNTGINILSNSSINSEFLDSDEVLDFTQIAQESTSTFTSEDGTEYVSEPYQYVKSFRYNSEVSLELIEQQYATSIDVEKIVNGQKVKESFKTDHLNEAIYLQAREYAFVMEVSQDYLNYDADANNPIRTKEFYNEGEFNITNNLEFEPSVGKINKGNKEQWVYKFTAGDPNISSADNFEYSINIKYDLPNSTSVTLTSSDDVVFKNKGIVLGFGAPEGSTFVTSAPQVPSIILRDPPGTRSFASITKGTSITFERSSSNFTNSNLSASLNVSLGPDVEISTGIGVAKTTKIDVTADQELGVSTSISRGREGVETQTFTFEQTISTSDDTDFVGAAGDLYIGNATNIKYGIINSLQLFHNAPTDAGVGSRTLQLKNKNDENVALHLYSQKANIIAEVPTNTFFTYSQKFILEELIPDLIENAKVQEAKEAVATEQVIPSSKYLYAQADLWKRVIQDNERSKFNALNNKASEEERIRNIIANSGVSNKDALYNLLRQNFSKNVSLDRGVQEIVNSVSTVTLDSKSYTKTIDLDVNIARSMGVEVDGVGATASFNTNEGTSKTETNNLTSENTTTFTYTLKDNDDNNRISVDVVNLFDGYGPIFASKGGVTSCPYEPEAVSFFFNDTNTDPNVIGTGGKILSEASVSLYKPVISVTSERLTGIPESDDAVFVLKLRNDSPVGQDLEHFLFIENGSLGLLTSNVDAQGVSVYLPYNEVVEFPVILKKNPSIDTYTFENIEVYLGDPCDGIRDILQTKNAETDLKKYPYIAKINLNVEFKKSCSKVTVSAPEENWVFNRNEAFSLDANGKVTNNTLPITFTDFNTDFAGFRKIELQYRNANASNWTKFKAYYGSQQLKDDAGDENGIVIESQNEFTFNWDIVGSKIADGNYQIRAVAFCTENITYESEIINGTINLTAPVLFGTPQPSDGILDIGEVISVRYNEAVNKGITTNITLRGLQNQQSIDHSVSVALDGSNNQIELPTQNLQSKNFTIQFWLDSKTTGTGVLLQQEDGPKISLNGDNVTFELDGASATTTIGANQYNFYSFIYKAGTNPQLEILQNGTVLKTETLTRELSFSNNNSIFIGGANVLGNIHDIRIWSKATTPGLATAEKDITLTGNEVNLVGYWPLSEGHGIVGVDKVRSRNAKVNLSWTIKPKGQGYEFSNNSFLTLDNVGFVQPTNFEDITLSFWIKASAGDSGTILSNGLGTDTAEEPILTNGFRNKWSLDLNSSGNLILFAENKQYAITSTSITDDNWHHVAMRLKRGANLTGFVDGKQVSSVSSQNIGGVAGSKILLGAKLNETLLGTITYENHLTAKIDELRLWNTSRSFEQIKRDRYFELDRETVGLLLYVNFNEEEANLTDKGPRYNVRKPDGVVQSFLSELNSAPRKFIEDSPAIKPSLKYINIPFSTVINNDEMIISPELTVEEWSLFEGQIVDVSVSEMYDVHFNKQLSPISFSAFVNRQEMEWFTAESTKEIVTEKIVNEPFSFTMDIVNKGGNNQDFSITGIPSYITASSISGTVKPNATKKITFVVDKELAMGTYNTNMYLQLNDGYSDRLNLQLRVIQQAPDWSVKAADYSYSMNLISQVKINGELSRDNYTKVGAFVEGNKRGEAYLVYDSNYDSYYAYLTVYSNVTSNETVTFKVWDALNGKIRIATIDGQQSTPFLENEVRGAKSSPVIFDSGDFSEQNISLNKGWTWVSFFVEDARFNNIDNAFSNLTLSDGDLIKHGSQFTRYENGFWSGSLTSLENKKAYKVRLNQQNDFQLKGNEVDVRAVNIAIESGWNWFAFPIHRNISVAEALAFFEPTDGDVVKDQFNFAIYDANAKEWTGTLRYFQANRGYMLRAAKAQTFNYPSTTNFAKSQGYQNPDNELIDVFAKYQSTMGIIAEVHGSEAYTYVKVYDIDNNLRGISKIEQVNNKRLAFINVFSNVDEQLSYRLSDDFNNEINLTENVIFTEDAVLGTLKTPIQLNQKALSTDSSIFKSVTLYPNPFSSEIIINSGDGTRISKIILYNTLGKKVLEQTVNSSNAKLNTDAIVAGVYMIKLINDKGNFITKKMVKTE
ncbi:T9SS type A sorting domain-containing protein [Polaribacter aestuariivivens]|uniref:T9SS type A sorting domain-containing protein n=1 Tax=Polaribacter aestuariivivens TaxID=2304626 RepID=A0A5S3N5U1_9FLAO|nr:LamG-like jellyroll fold domain-containing protein [Polaribacter aestuariivivens]TMM30537.1 T9SS type A sorting domain-containing protein [Polaribacter aestuariivivens]